VAPPAVAAVRSSGLRVVGRDSLERDSGRPREFLGALMTPGPNRPGAGGLARRPPGRGSWGLSFSEFRPSSPGARARIGHLPRRNPPSSIRRTGPCRPPLVLVRADPPIRTVDSRLSGQSLLVARQVRACRRPPRLCRAGTARAGWQPPGQGWPPYRPRGLDLLVAEEPRGLGLAGAARRPRLFSRFGPVLPGRASPAILALFPRRSPWLLFGKSAHG
jgi:hypothetical protein